MSNKFLYGCSGGPKNNGWFTFIKDGKLQVGVNNRPVPRVNFLRSLNTRPFRKQYNLFERLHYE